MGKKKKNEKRKEKKEFIQRHVMYTHILDN